MIELKVVKSHWSIILKLYSIIWILASIFFIVSLVFLSKRYHILLKVSCFIFAFGSFFMPFVTLMTKNFKEIGTLKFQPENILFTNSFQIIYNKDQIDNLQIIYKNPEKAPLSRNPQIDDGSNNYIEFDFIDNPIKYQILISSKSQLIRLLNFLNQTNYHYSIIDGRTKKKIKSLK
jgi:hypothetical protein